MKNNSFKLPDISSFTLHILAMTFMFFDHLWLNAFPSEVWMTCVGRLAFPIFAFMIVEGFYHTRNIKKYILRIFIFAIISEIPYDLMHGTVIFDPFSQNVMWTFLIALLGLWAIDHVRNSKGLVPFILVTVVALVLGMVACILLFTDYLEIGVPLIIAFYLFHERKWWCYLGQFAAMYYLNFEVMGGRTYFIPIFGKEYEVVIQAIAIFSLIPIWLYKGRQGHHSKAFQYFCYAFYPAHSLILALIARLLVYKF